MRTLGSTREETSRRVFDAALRIFAEKGFAATGIRELAQEAGLTSAALYHYMGTKEDLLVEIMKSTLEPLITVGRAILERDVGAEVQLGLLIEVHVWVHGSRPLATTITDTELRALRDERREEIMGLRDAYDRIWGEIVAAGIEQGRFLVEDQRMAVFGLLEACTGVARWYRADGRLSLNEVCEIHVDLAFGMLRARRGNRPVRRAQLDLGRPLDLLSPPARPEPLG